MSSSAETGEQQMEQGAHSDWVLDAAFSTDGKFVVSGSRDQSLKLVELASGRLVDNITGVSPGVPSGPIFAIARHPQKDLVAVGGGEGVLRTYMMHRVVERKIGDDSNLVRVYPDDAGPHLRRGVQPRRQAARRRQQRPGPGPRAECSPCPTPSCRRTT